MVGIMFYPSTYGASLDASSARVEAGQASSDAREAQSAVGAMQHDIARLLMITEALWLFLKKEHGYTDDALVQAITSIDMRDGVRDGKVTKSPPVACPACRRPNSGKHPNCIYCGKPLPLNPFAR